MFGNELLSKKLADMKRAITPAYSSSFNMCYCYLAKVSTMTAVLIRFLIFTLMVVNSVAAQQGDVKSRPLHDKKPSSRPAVTTRWYTLAAPDKDFIVKFPGAPRREAESEAPSGTMRNYALHTDFMLFRLSYVDVGVDPSSREGNQLPLTFRQQMLDRARERGWIVLRSELLRKNVYEQETWSPTKRNPRLRLHYVERNIVRYGRQYLLTCASLISERKVDHALCRQFFESFRVIKEPQPQ